MSFSIPDASDFKSLEYYPPYCPAPFVSKRERWTDSWAEGFGNCYPILSVRMYEDQLDSDSHTCNCLMMTLATRAHYLFCAAQAIPVDLISAIFNTIACASYSTSVLFHAVVCCPCLLCKNGREGLETIELNCSKIAFNYFKLMFTTASSATFHTALLPFNLICTECCPWQYFVDLKIYEVSSNAEENIDDSLSEIADSYKMICCSCCGDSHEISEYDVINKATVREEHSEPRREMDIPSSSIYVSRR